MGSPPNQKNTPKRASIDPDLFTMRRLGIRRWGWLGVGPAAVMREAGQAPPKELYIQVSHSPRPGGMLEVSGRTVKGVRPLSC